MSKWKCDICGVKFENFHAQGFDNLIYCPLCYFKKMYADETVKNSKLKTKIKNNNKFIDSLGKYICSVNGELLDNNSKQTLQDIVNKIDKFLEEDYET